MHVEIYKLQSYSDYNVIKAVFNIEYHSVTTLWQLTSEISTKDNWSLIISTNVDRNNSSGCRKARILTRHQLMVVGAVVYRDGIDNQKLTKAKVIYDVI